MDSKTDAVADKGVQLSIRDKMALSVEEVAALTGKGRSTIYAAMNEGALPARKDGRRTFIMRDDLDRFLRSTPTYLTNKTAVAANA